MEFLKEDKRVKLSIPADCFIADHGKTRIEINGSLSKGDDMVWVCVIKDPGEPGLIRGKRVNFLDLSDMLYEWLGKKMEAGDTSENKT